MAAEPAHLTSPLALDDPLVSVCIPAYNEAATIEQVIRSVAALPYRLEIIVVDDGSRDTTAEIVRGLQSTIDGLQLIQQPNGGKGAAVRAAITASHGDVVFIQDADLEYDPADVPSLLAPIIDGHADVVYGTRLRGGQPQRAHLFWHYVGNRFLSLVTNVLFNTTISDMEVGYKAFVGDFIRSIDLVSSDFRIEPEMTAKTLRRPGVRLYEVPISYYGRTFEEGKKITWRDGFWALEALVLFRFGSP